MAKFFAVEEAVLALIELDKESVDLIMETCRLSLVFHELVDN